MLSLKLFNMKKAYFVFLFSILIVGSTVAQIDNGVNYISNSISGKIMVNSHCDLIYTKDGKVISALVKDTLAKNINYKMCNDYGTNATVNGDLYLLNNSKIKKIVFSDGFIKYYGSSKSSVNIDKRNFIFISAGSNEFSEKFTELGFLKQKSKNFGIGSSFSFMRVPRVFFVNHYSIFLDFKFSFLSNKRIQPFIISSCGGTLTSVGYSSNPNYFYDSFSIDFRLTSGLDFFTKNNKMVFSMIANGKTQSILDAIFGAKISFKL